MDHSGGNLTKHRKNIAVLWLLIAIAVLGLLGRLVFLMVFRSEHYSQMALELHQRERSIKAARGRILDAKGKVITETVHTVRLSAITFPFASKILPLAALMDRSL